MVRDRAWWALFAVLVVAQLVVLYDPSPGPPPAIPDIDKLVHLGIFFVPTFVAACARPSRRVFLLVAAVLAVHAPVSELLQGALLPERSADPWDAVADLTGVLLGCLAGVRLTGRVARRRQADSGR